MKRYILKGNNSKSLRTAAHICNSILEILGISEMLWYKTLENFKMAAKNQSKNIKIKKTSSESFSRPDLSI